MKTASDMLSLEQPSAQQETRPFIAYNRKLTKNIVTTMAYLLGIKKYHLDNVYLNDCPELYEKLNEDKAARIMRNLCLLRNVMLRDYKVVENNLNALINIDNMPKLVDNEDIKWLRSQGLEVLKTNTTINHYIVFFNKLILDNIDKCKHLIPSWVAWEYIRDLFLMPGCYVLPKNTKADVLNKAKKRYWENAYTYPFQAYINWPKEILKEDGNILNSDEKFLVLLYDAHGVHFNAHGLVRDAGDATKTNIYQFIERSFSTVLVVDCENCDIYNLFSTLHNLSPAAVSKLSKVILYDDPHTTPAWSLISKFLRIPVEHIRINRVSQYKSLVDITLTAGVCREHFQNGVGSFILASSDSDFWGLYKALPEADFLILMEYSKTGSALKDAMANSGIYYCAMDDFSKGNIEEFKEMAFKASLQAYVDDFNETGIWSVFDVDDIVDSIFEECRFTGTEKQLQSDKNRYLNKYLKALRLEVIEDKSEAAPKKRLKMSIGV
ncbi:MAG: NYN domain-containing protein [Oscillospiraceae bacterium]|jgi:hypothetical protein|nr:NYN domain-containing protein [Oscillospiraceae bacterium]